jgi:hypothetical protein
MIAFTTWLNQAAARLEHYGMIIVKAGENGPSGPFDPPPPK